MFLFQMDCDGRTDVDTGLALGALLFVYFGKAVLHRDGLFRAFVNTGLASDAEVLINNSGQ